MDAEPTSPYPDDSRPYVRLGDRQTVASVVYASARIPPHSPGFALPTAAQFQAAEAAASATVEPRPRPVAPSVRERAPGRVGLAGLHALLERVRALHRARLALRPALLGGVEGRRARDGRRGVRARGRSRPRADLRRACRDARRDPRVRRAAARPRGRLRRRLGARQARAMERPPAVRAWRRQARELMGST